MTYSIPSQKTHQNPQTPSSVHPCYMFGWTLSCSTTPNFWLTLVTLNAHISKQKLSRAWAEDTSVYEGTLFLTTTQRWKHSGDILTAVPQISEGKESPADRLSPGWRVSGCGCQWGGDPHEPQLALYLPPFRYPAVFYLGSPTFPRVQIQHLITCRKVLTCLGACTIETRDIILVLAF